MARLPAHPRRLLFVAPRWASVAGGSEALIRAFAEQLSQRDGFAVEVATTTATNTLTWANDYPTGMSRDQSLSVHRFPVRAPTRMARQLDRHLSDYPGIRRRLSRLDCTNPTVRSPALADFVHKEADRFDAIIAAPYFYGMTRDAIAAAPNRAVIIPCLHDEPAAYLEETGHLLRSACVRIFNSDVERALAARIHGAKAAVGPVIGVGLEASPHVASEEAVRRVFRLEGDYLLYVGRAHPLKGVQELVQAVQAHNRSNPNQSVTLVFAGDGEYDPPQDSKIRKLGYVDESFKNGLLASALANISFSRLESLSLVLLEAWALGTPSIVHTEAEVLDWQVSRSGCGLSIRTPDELGKAIQGMRDAKNRARMAEAGLRFVKVEYSWDHVLDAFVAALPS